MNSPSTATETIPSKIFLHTDSNSTFTLSSLISPAGLVWLVLLHLIFSFGFATLFCLITSSVHPRLLLFFTEPWDATCPSWPKRSRPVALILDFQQTEERQVGSETMKKFQTKMKILPPTLQAGAGTRIYMLPIELIVNSRPLPLSSFCCFFRLSLSDWTKP